MNPEIKALVEKYHIPQSTAYTRLSLGWTLEDFERGYKKNQKRGGERNSPEYNKYHQVKSICNKNNMPYSPVLESFESFNEFLKSISWTPGMKFSIKDFNKPFSFENISINHSIKKNRRILEISNRYNIPYCTCRSRLIRGWTLEDFERGYKYSKQKPSNKKERKRYSIPGYTPKELSCKFGINMGTTYSRLRNGWTLEDFERGFLKRRQYHIKDLYRKRWWSLKSYCRRRNILLCEEWENDFDSFKEFLISIGWKSGMYICIRDYSKPFSSDNYSLDRSSKRCNEIFSVSSKEVREKYHISRQLLSHRLKNGWTLKDFERGYKKNQKRKEKCL